MKMTNKASALLLSFFMMTMLILVAISVSVLVIHDVRTVQTIVAGTQSYYAAEGMSELGLATVKNNLPGYEPTFGDYNFSSTSVASMVMNARASDVPCANQSSIDGGWRALGLNESVQLPLFAQISEDGSKEPEKVKQFSVEFYVGDENGDPISPSIGGDVLRWKILGMYNAVTEAISEYIPLTGTGISADFPTVFGTDATLPIGYSTAKYFHSAYPAAIYYDSYPIADFLTDHSYNYLVLTNVVQGSSDNIIYFRLHAEDVEGVCEYTQMASAANTNLGTARQELITLVKEGENLPVFDFVLYHTAGEEAGPVLSNGFEPVAVQLPSDVLPTK